MTDEEVFDIVCQQLACVAENRHIAPSEIKGDTGVVTDLGVDSLSIMLLVDGLERALGVENLPIQRWIDEESQRMDSGFQVASLVRMCRAAMVQ